MEILIISLAACFTAVHTFFTGFGLGTILTPVFVIFFPVDLAITLTGVFHFFNNIFKVFLIGRNADLAVLIRFGIPAVFTAALGAWALLNIAYLKPLWQNSLGTHSFTITPGKLVSSILLALFVLAEVMPFLNRLKFTGEKLVLGGSLSGFFGGLSGHQGALRSAFLVKAGLSKEIFIGTSAVIACFIDFTRLALYATRFGQSGLGHNLALILSATLAALAGAYLGRRLLQKITFKLIQKLVTVLLLLISIALGTGIL